MPERCSPAHTSTTRCLYDDPATYDNFRLLYVRVEPGRAPCRLIRWALSKLDIHVAHNSCTCRPARTAAAAAAWISCHFHIRTNEILPEAVSVAQALPRAIIAKVRKMAATAILRTPYLGHGAAMNRNDRGEDDYNIAFVGRHDDPWPESKHQPSGCFAEA